MSEPASDLPIVAKDAPTLDQPGQSTSESDLARNTLQLDKTPLLFILDHIGDRYPIPWKQAQDYTHFKFYVEEIYARNGDEVRLNQVRNDKFNVSYDKAGETCVILPSLWNSFVHEGIVVRISFGQDPKWEPSPSTSTGNGVDFIDVDVDVGNNSEDGSVSGTHSLDDELSVQDSDHGTGVNGTEQSDTEEGDTEEGDTEEGDTESEIDDGAIEAPIAEPVRAVIKPVNEEGAPLSFGIDTRWAAKYLSASKENSNSDASLSKNPRNGRDQTTDTLKITRAFITTTENRTTLEVYELPGPENINLTSAVAMRWVHIHGNALDWTRFKDTCLMLPDLPDRTKFLVAKTLHKIEKEHIKAFLGGMFIEPGTVLRSDECNQPDPGSVIFSCTPYFELRKPIPANVQIDRLHPARTLIQSYYPYEPVRERDEEQAYRRSGSAKPDTLIHVPTLWMLNIDSKTVVSCGYEPLSGDFTNSMRVLQEEIKHPRVSGQSTTNSVRLHDLDGRVLLYSPDEFGTFLQIEQRIRELRRLTTSLWHIPVPWLLLQHQEEKILATPSNWPTILQQRNTVIIDLYVVDKVPEGTSNTLPSFLVETRQHGSVPPFYHWPSTLSKDEIGLDKLPEDVTHAIKCIEQVEKTMLNETLPESDTGGPVDGTFTSTKYYESLSEKVYGDVGKPLLSLAQTGVPRGNAFYRNHHQLIVQTQSSKLPGKAQEFTNLVHDTLNLFVGNVDKSTVLRKVWGAMENITTIVERFSKIPGCESDPKEYNDPEWKAPKTGTRSWRIRTPTTSYTYANQHATKLELPLPNDDKAFGATVKKCRRCIREAPFNDPNEALQHLRRHVAAEASKQGDSGAISLARDVSDWKDWIRNDDQALVEGTITGAGIILDRAIKEARSIFEQLRELVNGVQDDQGNLSNLYSFPRKFLGTLHRLLVFYFAVERSMHYTEECFDKTAKGGYQEDYPYTERGLEILNRFSEGVKSLIQQARVELCEMVRLKRPKDPAERISWGAESISSWLIRRLIVKPLDRSMTVGDMYREYLTTLQFQVNHRPGKRLLRSINLLHEELTILAQVNEWQAKLVRDYMCVLDDTTYPVDIPSRRALYPYERLVLNSCLENLNLTREEYQDQIRRCGPLSDTTKQSAEINEEDHGKAILVFTVVTVIFLPLSFVTSYLGMNTSDIRDMDNKQSLFWEISLPLTVGVMAVMLAIAYNGDEIRDFTSLIYRTVTGKQDRSLSARGISVLQRNRIPKGPTDSTTTLSLADDAEYATPRATPDYYQDAWYSKRSKRLLSSGPPAQDAIYIEESSVLPQARYAEPSVRKPAFPSARPEAVPYSLNETISFPESRVVMSAPPPPASRYPRTNIYNSKTSEAAASPILRTNPPTYLKIDKMYIDPSILDAMELPWEDDASDPNYIIVLKELSMRETDRLFEQSRRLIEARAPAKYDEKGRYRTDDPWQRGKYEYAWENQKRARRRRRKPKEYS